MSEASRKDGLEIVLFEQAGEEPLCQILGVFGRASLATDVGVERVPIGFTERGQGVAGVVGTGREHDAPTCGGESASVACRGSGRHAFQYKAAEERM